MEPLTATGTTKWLHTRWFEPHPANPILGSERKRTRAMNKPSSICATCNEVLYLHEESVEEDATVQVARVKAKRVLNALIAGRLFPSEADALLDALSEVFVTAGKISALNGVKDFSEDTEVSSYANVRLAQLEKD